MQVRPAASSRRRGRCGANLPATTPPALRPLRGCPGLPALRSLLGLTSNWIYTAMGFWEMRALFLWELGISRRPFPTRTLSLWQQFEVGLGGWLAPTGGRLSLLSLSPMNQ